MNRYYYDLHIHSCLSPCGDEDMTPNNIAGMGTLNGLNIMALTDHNTCKNCPAFYKAAKRQGIIPVAGMELTTAEEIHLVCLFPTLEAAMDFDGYVEKNRMKIPNREDIFGRQPILDENDEETGKEEYLLLTAAGITAEEAPGKVRQFGGICYPAHIDREANGIIGILGTFPENTEFKAFEMRDGEKAGEYISRYKGLRDKRLIVSSDAHYLWDIKEKNEYFLIDDEPYSSDYVREKLFGILEGKV